MPPTPRTHKLAGPGAYHVNGRLKNYSLKYGVTDMIGDKVLPPIYVTKETDEFTKWDKMHIVPGSDGPRGHRDAATEIRSGATAGTYQLRFYSHSEFVSKRERDNADEWVDPDEKAIEDVKEVLMVQKEIRAAALAFAPANYGSSNKTTLVGPTQFSDPTSDPISVFQSGFQVVRRNARKRRMDLSLTFGDNVYETLCEHPNIVARFQYTSGGAVSHEQLASVLRVKPENIHVGISSYNSANEGQADVETAIWGNNVLISYTHPNPTLNTLTLGASFQKRDNEDVWTVDHGNPRGEEHVNEMSYDQQLIASDLGYLIVDAI